MSDNPFELGDFEVSQVMDDLPRDFKEDQMRAADEQRAEDA